MSQVQTICPLCGSKLELKQINLTVAVIVCPDLKCPFPVDGECIEVQRKLEDIRKPLDVILQEINKRNELLGTLSQEKDSTNDISDSQINTTSSSNNDSLLLDLDSLLNENTSANSVFNESLPQLEISDMDQFINELLQ